MPKPELLKVARYSPHNAPGFAKHSSTFKNDERCYDDAYFVGKNEHEVWGVTTDTFMARPGHYIDYDVNYSTEGDCYVGVLARDYE